MTRIERYLIAGAVSLVLIIVAALLFKPTSAWECKEWVGFSADRSGPTPRFHVTYADGSKDTLSSAPTQITGCK